MSPTPSRTRSASSSHSLERDRLSSHSRASVTSSGDDEVDSLHSVPVEISSNHSTRKIAVQMHSRAAVLSSKPTRNSSASSAPKSSFDSALRLMVGFIMLFHLFFSFLELLNSCIILFTFYEICS